MMNKRALGFASGICVSIVLMVFGGISASGHSYGGCVPPPDSSCPIQLTVEIGGYLFRVGILVLIVSGIAVALFPGNHPQTVNAENSPERELQLRYQNRAARPSNH